MEKVKYCDCLAFKKMDSCSKAEALSDSNYCKKCGKKYKQRQPIITIQIFEEVVSPTHIDDIESTITLKELKELLRRVEK